MCVVPCLGTGMGWGTLPLARHHLRAPCPLGPQQLPTLGHCDLDTWTRAPADLALPPGPAVRKRPSPFAQPLRAHLLRDVLELLRQVLHRLLHRLGHVLGLLVGLLAKRQDLVLPVRLLHRLDQLVRVRRDGARHGAGQAPEVEHAAASPGRRVCGRCRARPAGPGSCAHAPQGEEHMHDALCWCSLLLLRVLRSLAGEALVLLDKERCSPRSRSIATSCCRRCCSCCIAFWLLLRRVRLARGTCQRHLRERRERGPNQTITLQHPRSWQVWVSCCRSF